MVKKKATEKKAIPETLKELDEAIFEKVSSLSDEGELLDLVRRRHAIEPDFMGIGRHATAKNWLLDYLKTYWKRCSEYGTMAKDARIMSVSRDFRRIHNENVKRMKEGARL
jgi:hypothetical protein